MAGNIFGHLFRISTFGESHGEAIGVIVDGCPAGLPIDLEFIQSELDKRRPGQSKSLRSVKKALRYKSYQEFLKDKVQVHQLHF